MSDNIVYNFAGIEGDSGDIQGVVRATAQLLSEGEQSLAALAAVWGGTSSETYQSLQQRWNSNEAELIAALEDLGHKIAEAGVSMARTEAMVTNTFSA
ncbi:WXG100 family type VII secretion target [uncultured Mycolicibacterium sp.]|mgnify:CR=1 FL=1|uniref:WXG100 family type VII secretion target n=1 Tax=uncultured Mycolicibacterium sp. TaxID=2320817 RepID=UPI00262DB4FE|nr:WXG100 family type VII secretion target [uncultured Mycolicibacterium sp.]